MRSTSAAWAEVEAGAAGAGGAGGRSIGVNRARRQQNGESGGVGGRGLVGTVRGSRGQGQGDRGVHGRKDGDSAAPPLDGGGRRGGRTERESERFSRLCARARSRSAFLFRRRDTERGDTHKHSATPPPMVRVHTSRPASPSPPTHTQSRARVGRLRPHTRAGFSHTRGFFTPCGNENQAGVFFLPLLYSPHPSSTTPQALPGQVTPEGVPSFKLVLVGDGGTGAPWGGAQRRALRGAECGRGQHTSTRIGNRERASRGRFHRSLFSLDTLLTTTQARPLL